MMIISSWDLRVPQGVIEMGVIWRQQRGIEPPPRHIVGNNGNNNKNPSFVDWVHCARLHPQANLIWIDGVSSAAPRISV